MLTLCFWVEVCFNSSLSYMLLYVIRSVSPLMCLNRNVLSIHMNNDIIYAQLMIRYFCHMIALETPQCLTCDRALPPRSIYRWYYWRRVLRYAIISNLGFAPISDMRSRYGVLLHLRTRYNYKIGFNLRLRMFIRTCVMWHHLKWPTRWVWYWY